MARLTVCKVGEWTLSHISVCQVSSGCGRHEQEKMERQKWREWKTQRRGTCVKRAEPRTKENRRKEDEESKEEEGGVAYQQHRKTLRAHDEKCNKCQD